MVPSRDSGDSCRLFQPVWIRFRVTKDLPFRDLVLFNSNLLPDVTEYRLYDENGALLQRKQIKEGVRTQPEWHLGVHGFQMDLAERTTAEVLLRVESRRPTTRAFYITTPVRYLRDQIGSDILSNIYYGTMLCIAVMCLFIYARIGRRVYLVYGLFALCSALNIGVTGTP